MKKIIVSLSIFFILAALTVPFFAQAEESYNEEVFKAVIMEVLDRQVVDDNTQQNLKLLGLQGDWENKEFVYRGISDITVLNSTEYQVGDKVLVNWSINSDGQDVFYVVDYVRESALLWLALIFIIVMLLVGRFKGLKAMLSLGVSFLIIMKFLVPQILAGRDPLMVGVASSFVILLAVIYITEGLNRKSHLAVVTVFVSLLVTTILAVVFSNWTKLTGMSDEESMFLLGVGKNMINFQGLLLVGIILGTLGILDDIVIGQIETVSQIKEANPKLSKQKVFQMASKVGNSHLGAVVNTLFLAYAGASLPLLLLFGLNQPPFVTFSQAINNEILAVEIVRTLVGSIGLALAVPIATALAVYFYRRG